MRHTKQRNYAILEAPSPLGLFPGGVETLSEVLLAAGLLEGLQARYAGRLEPPAYDSNRDKTTLLLNPHCIADYSLALADSIGGIFGRNELPIVLGGDCSILLGCLLACRCSGRTGLLFLDAHADFFQPEAEPEGQVASMELAFATGRGPGLLSDLEGLRPLVNESDVVAFARRDFEDAENAGSQRIEESGITLIDLDQIRRIGMEQACSLAMDRLNSQEFGRFWVHLDADVLDDALMPAVDFRLPGGLSWEDLHYVLSSAFASGRVMGLSVTIYNPKLDPGHTAGMALTRLLIEAL